jgi:hypothetical protein
MKLVKSLSLLVVGLGTAGIMASQGCSSDDSSSSSSSGGAAAAGRTPPAAPAGAPATPSTESRTFALNQLFLGETGRNGVALNDAWKDYGYNLDGKTTTKESKDVCQRQSGASSAKQEDGKEGIDNAFGRTVLGFILGLLQTPSKTLNDSIKAGTFTILMDITGLTDDAAQTNTGLNGRLLVGGQYNDDTTKKPTFSPTDDWPYRANPIVPIDGAYITNGTFVNGSGGAKVELSLDFTGAALSLVINRATITFKHAPPNDITDGTISGVINTEDLVTAIEKIAGRISEQLCNSSTLDTTKSTIRQASDIRDDGTNPEGVPCNAISIGLGFTGKRIGAPKTIAKEPPASPDPCTTPAGDAGADGGQ